MDDLTIGILAVVFLFVMVVGGVPIAFSLIVTSLVGIFLMTGSIDQVALTASNTAFGGVGDYIFAVIPLFILMGGFMSNSLAAHYLFDFARMATRKFIGGMASATVFANGIFGAVTGVSVASAAIFARIAVPEMLKRGYNNRLALGTVAGSSVLGMLLPPSLLMILYGVLANVSIGTLFIAGIGPAILLSLMYVLTITVMGSVRPEWVGRQPRKQRDFRRLPSKVLDGPRGETPTDINSGDVSTVQSGAAQSDVSTGRTIVRALPVGVLIVVVLGGIWGGWFTPTEAAGVGAVGALVVALGFKMSGRNVLSSFRETAMSIGAIMLLLIGAQMFARMLAQSGIVTSLTTAISGSGLSALAVVVLFILVLLLMGAILDSSSILLIMVPVMAPVVQALGIDPIWFAIIVIFAIEIGLLTPPFGMSPFAMSGVLGKGTPVSEIFIGAIPFVITMLVTLVILMVFPGVITWLPSLVLG